MVIYICDNQKERAQLYKDRLEACCRAKGWKAQITMFDDMHYFLGVAEDASPDLVYLELERKQANAIDLARSLREGGYQGEIIFYTEDPDHWPEAFDVGAFHYLLRGRIPDERFSEIFYRAVGKQQRKNEEIITFTCAGKVRNIPVEQINYFEVQHRILTVHYDEGEFSFYSSLGKIEEQLFGRGFLRIHQSFLVAKSAIREHGPAFVELFDGTRLPVGRAYSKVLARQ